MSVAAASAQEGAPDRTLAPPSQRTAELIANDELGAYRLLRARDSQGPADPRPGQFYMLATEREWGGGDGERPYLPRAFSFSRVRADGDEPELEFLLEAIGPGTERLAALGQGEGLRLVGPLGRGFEPPPPGSRPLLVGGGIGTAPLLCLQDDLGPDAEALLGFRSAEYARAAELFAGAPAVATDDGSAGRAGLVTDLLQERLACGRPGAAGDPSAPAVFACGPPAMLEAVRALCAQAEVPAQLALESGMACGFGACFGCVVPTRDGYRRLCLDGPVVAADRLGSALFSGAGH